MTSNKASKTIAAPFSGQQVLGGALVTLVCVGLLATYTTKANLPVVAPMASMLAVSFLFYVVIYNRAGRTVPLLEIGPVFVAAVTLYGVYPLFCFLANGLVYTTESDGRLFAAQPTAEDVGKVAWLYFLYLLPCAATYLFFRGNYRTPPRAAKGLSHRAFLALVSCYVIIRLFFLIVDHLYDLSYESYTETYLLTARLPLLLAQIWSHLHGVENTLELLCLTALFYEYERYRYAIWGWLVLVVGISLLRVEGRTGLVILLGAAIILYHHMVRPLRPHWLLLIGAVLLLAFLAFGWMREMRGKEVGRVDERTLASSNEFEGGFGTAYELWDARRTDTMPELPTAFWLSDFLSLVPQQFLPFQKQSPGLWYIWTFHPDIAAAGGGRCFGAVSEGMVGGGWSEVVFRGALLGYLWALVHRQFTRHQPTFWRIGLYLWIIVCSYRCFRSTTFTLLPMFAFEFLPAYIGMRFLEIGGAHGKRRDAGVPAARATT